MSHAPLMPYLTISDASAFSVGKALTVLEGLGIKPEQIDVQVASEIKSTLSEICDQTPKPGTPLSREQSIILTVNPGASLKNKLKIVLPKIARHLLFSSTRDYAIKTLCELFSELSKIIDARPESNWQFTVEPWHKRKEQHRQEAPLKEKLLDKTRKPLKFLQEESIFSSHLQEVFQLLTDEDFLNLVEDYFRESNFEKAYSTHKPNYRRFLFFLDLQAAEDKLHDAEQITSLNLFKRYLTFLYARVEQFETKHHADLLGVFIKETINSSMLGINEDDLDCFEVEQRAWLCQDLKSRPHWFFTSGNYIKKLARYLEIEPATLKCDESKNDGGLRISAVGEKIGERQQWRAKILDKLFVPVTVDIEYVWQSPYMILSRPHCNVLGKSRLK